MKQLIKPGIWKILEAFYKNRNMPIHLREIAKQTKLNTNSTSRFLNHLEKNEILKSEKEANLKKFSLTKHALPNVFPLFDHDQLESLPLLRKNAIKYFINKLEDKPIFAVVFGSTATNTFRKNSDVDLLVVANSQIETKKAKQYAENQTNITIQIFPTTLEEFKNNLIKKTDYVMASAIESGFPVFNNKYYYEETNNG